MSVVEQTPRFTLHEVAALLEQRYGLTGDLRALPGDRDQNVLLRMDDGTRFVLKIANADEDARRLDFQHEAMRVLAAADTGYVFPRVCATTDGGLLTEVAGANGVRHWMRLLSYVPGVCLAQVNPHSTALLEDVGRLVGTIDRAFAGWSHPDMHRPLHWDMRYAAHLRPQLVDIDASERRALVAAILDRYDAQVAPLLHDLRASVIYNDANYYNVLVNEPDFERHVVGTIDFGDMVYGAVVCDLAVAATYAMFGKDDPLAAAAAVVRGFHAVLPLEEREVALVYDLVRTRLALSVCHAATQRRAMPTNEYLGISEGPAWRLLEQMQGIDRNWAHYVLRHACGWEPVSHHAAVVGWIAAHPEAVASVVDADLAHEPLVVFDLSVASTDAVMDHMRDAPRFEAAVFAHMADAGVRVGIGRYDEPRLVYSADQFRSDSIERRTIHLGIDVFMVAGAPVYAALDGVVHSLQDNNLPLDYGPTIILEHIFGDVRFWTLYGHLDRESLALLKVGAPVQRGEQIARIGTSEVNGGWPPHLHVQIITDMLGLAGDFPGVGTAKDRAVWLSVAPDANLLLGIPTDRFPAPLLDADAIMAARAHHLGRSLSTAYQRHLEIVRGHMQYLYDANGRAYLDAVNNVPHVGHSRPEVVRAAQRQMAVLNTNSRYLHPVLARYIERLAATMPDPLSVVFLVNSGSEANELALRLARTFTGRNDMVVLDHAYHGHTSALVDLSPYKHDGPGGTGAPVWVHTAPMPDPYRGAYRGYDVTVGEAYARDVAATWADATVRGRDIAGFISESLLGCGGQIVLPDGFLRAVYADVRAAGGVCIADEVQVGFGRVGSHRWGFETQGVVPDIVTLGKPIGNGHPLAAVITTPAIADAFANGMEYFNTFGGNPVSCAVGLAVLDVIERDGLQSRAADVGEHLRAGLRTLQERHAIIGDVRGLGMFIGAELVLDRERLTPADREASYIAERMKDHGILIGTDGPMHNVLKIKPPLVFGRDDAERLVATLDRVLAEDAVRGRLV